MTAPDAKRRHGADAWDRHWDRYAEMTRANPGPALRRRLIFRLLGDDAAGADATILELGCGTGDLLAALARRYPRARLAGIDGSESGLGVTRRKAPAALLARGDLAAADGVPAEFVGWASHVVCSEVLEHVDDPVRVLVNAGRCMRPGGRLVVTVPGGPMYAFARHLGHRTHYTKQSLGETLQRAGFRIEALAAAGFPVFNLYRVALQIRGDRVIADADGRPGPLVRSAMAVFRWLMPLTLFDSPWGWQIVAAARKPA